MTTTIGLALTVAAHAQSPSPVGLWTSIDDVTKAPKAVIHIALVDGQLQGTIERLILKPGDDRAPTCIKCDGSLRNAPIVGLQILSGFRLEDSSYVDGTILDPATGKTYRSRMTLTHDGAALEVRGYIGVPAFGRTQTWTRVK
jgi:uncharacterized protein (DUF2147 family)